MDLGRALVAARDRFGEHVYVTYECALGAPFDPGFQKREIFRIWRASPGHSVSSLKLISMSPISFEDALDNPDSQCGPAASLEVVR